ncbi:hypothetical protein KC19_5G063900 [Ceratodon purpureus]|uniref:Uncharacterized protein n=1 Tax=Ceratodon purpureus TaxID=3225 RepID=A0A8T0HYI8_CERPU|nr:hypothetical protein KC19_5G063900 [Ceratodon purpureus]
MPTVSENRESKQQSPCRCDRIQCSTVLAHEAAFHERPRTEALPTRTESSRGQNASAGALWRGGSGEKAMMGSERGVGWRAIEGDGDGGRGREGEGGSSAGIVGRML